MRTRRHFKPIAHSKVIAFLILFLNVSGREESLRRKTVGDWLREQCEPLVERFIAEGRTTQHGYHIDIDMTYCMYATVEEIPSLPRGKMSQVWDFLTRLKHRWFRVTFVEVIERTQLPIFHGD